MFFLEILALTCGLEADFYFLILRSLSYLLLLLFSNSSACVLTPISSKGLVSVEVYFYSHTAP